MATPIVRLLPSAAADGATNMAADEVLLNSAQAGNASLRFYTWREPTLSLGYFQPVAERLADPLLAERPFVRRQSGGGAILHDRELTYCLALPAGAPWQSTESWLCRFHLAAAAALASFAVTGRLVACGEEQGLDSFLCFQHQTPGDVLVGAGKVVGSAQRRYRGALMQHGSILLHQSTHTPALPAVAELGQVHIATPALEAAILRQLRHLTGWQFEPDDWTSAERKETERLRIEKYGTNAWNRRR